ncbi:MAG: PUA domain-containing protein [Promethearchaeota archaeon]
MRKLCLHPDTNILTDIGSIKASDFFSNQSGVYTLDKCKINNVKPSAVQKIKSPLSLIKITMSSGISFSVTNDHELLMSTKKGYTMIEAKNLQKGDFLVKSLIFPEASNELIISDLLDDNYLVQQDEIKQKCKEAFIAKYGSLRAMNRELNLDRKPFSEKSIHAIKIKHLKLAGIYRSVKRDIYRFKTSKGKIIELRELNEDFFYLLGLIASDRNNSRENKTIRYTRVKFHNQEKVLIDKFRTIYQSIFPDFEIREIKLKKDLWELDISNSFFATIAASLGIKSPKKHLDIAPIVNVKPELIRAFLRGYFDGDGSVSYKKLKTNCKTRISLFTVYHKEAIDLHKMLLKVGVTNKIFTRTRCDDGKEFDYYEVSIGNISAEKLFIKTIGTNHPKKDKLFKKIEDLDHESAPKDHLHIGLHYIEEIRKNKSQLGKNLGGNLTRILQNSIPITRNFYKKAASIVKLPDLDDCIIEKIVDIQTISGTDYVYDMTVPTTHNFLIETGFVSSNCHDIGVVLGVSGQMEELRRTKSGLFREENSVSLQDLLDAKILYDETGNEEELRDIIRPFEELFTNYPKIIVRDLAINAICYGAKLAIPGVLKLSKGIQKGTPVVIMSQKGEAIALATALLNTKTILEASSGLCAKIDTVFMARDVYPKSW